VSATYSRLDDLLRDARPDLVHICTPPFAHHQQALTCLRAGVSVLAGRVLSKDQSYAVDGRVAPNGAVRVQLSAGSQAAGGFGRLSRNAGQGLWRTRSGECSGQWTAARE